MSNSAVVVDGRGSRVLGRSATWERTYILQVAMADLAVAILAATTAIEFRFGDHANAKYLVLSLLLPVLWVVGLWINGGYERRLIGTGSDEFRRVLNAGVGRTAVLALASYAVNNELSRIYLVTSMRRLVTFDLLARLALRKRLHGRRKAGQCMSTVIAVGHKAFVADLVMKLRREPHQGLKAVAVCLINNDDSAEVAGVAVVGNLEDAADVVRRCAADTVAVLPCPEMNGVRLRELPWQREKTSTDLCVAPSLLDVSGPRTTVRPTAGLTLLYVHHPQLSGPRQALKDLFDRCAAPLALMLLSPLMIGIRVNLSDHCPALFIQMRVGKDSQSFKIYKFRTMVVNAEKLLAELRDKNEFNCVLFKMRRDPRVTAIGARLRPVNDSAGTGDRENVTGAIR